ncbi:MAG: dTDP-4-amino-4,6-dideoxy-D-glucose transaminase [Bacteroidetes bacterium ADurb.Bin217]|nr:MAG: dTDP-4-amino-4,6-dideoxy-D-glucose transaminase [Bacteroidetes bacterium ADurb.Bin217]
MINVTQPYLPPLDEFTPYLEQIWKNKWLTNNGPFHQQFEAALCEYLGVPYISVFSNGTLALLTALQALDIKGEVITTPYSFVATAHSLLWNNITPVFVDVDPILGNMDATKIEDAITEKTSAILPVHVYGNPCNHIEINAIAKKHNLKLIYDAAHCFGVKENGISICNYGDLSILSFHATKVFNTFEGGAIVCHTKEMKQHIDDLKNFGFRNETTVIAAGINAKMNEVQAAFGLLQLKYIDQAIAKRKHIAEFYTKELSNIPGIRLIDSYQLSTINYQLPDNCKLITHNYSYFPIFISEQEYGKSRDQVYEELKTQGIYARRYFYPLISDFPMYSHLLSAQKNNVQHAHRLAEEVLCLPIYPDLEQVDVEKIISLLQK